MTRSMKAAAIAELSSSSRSISIDGVRACVST
jgi:hypothetical protein